jgi:hypothetical protein
MIRLVGDMNPGPKLPPCNLGRSFNREQTLRRTSWNIPTLGPVHLCLDGIPRRHLAFTDAQTRILSLDSPIPRTAEEMMQKESFGTDHDWENGKLFPKS